MAGALAERVFVSKLAKVGFTDVTVLDRQPFSMAAAADYPLFTPDLLELMERLLPPSARQQVATSVTVTAQKPV